MADTNKERLDRIESKLDQMAEVVVSLARVEEKLQASEEYACQCSHKNE